jgi:hypothetical protein
MGPGWGSWTHYHFALNSSSSSTEIYLGNEVMHELSTYPDPSYGTVTDEYNRYWNAISVVGCNARPTY